MNKKSLKGDENRRKYLKPPSTKKILNRIKRAGVDIAQFERFFNIPKTVLWQVIKGYRKLPPKYWHLIYGKPKSERVTKAKPYTVGYTKNKVATDTTNRIDDLMK